MQGRRPVVSCVGPTGDPQGDGKAPLRGHSNREDVVCPARCLLCVVPISPLFICACVCGVAPHGGGWSVCAHLWCGRLFFVVVVLFHFLCLVTQNEEGCIKMRTDMYTHTHTVVVAEMFVLT